MSVRIVGFNLSHDSSVCLLVDGVVMGALALERVTHVKRGAVAAHAYPAAMAALTRRILDDFDLRAGDVDFWIASSTETRNAEEEARLMDLLGLMAPPERCLALPHPGHHLAHASAAFYCSSFSEAAALVIDAYGSRVHDGRERETGFRFRYGAPAQRILEMVRPEARIAGQLRAGSIWLPDDMSGIGEIYRVVTLALGFREAGTKYDDAGKTMGLAAYGKRLSAQNLFIELGEDGLRFDKAAGSLVELGLARREEQGLRLIARSPETPLNAFHADLAAQVQSEFEEACLFMAHQTVERAQSRALVLSGGCFLNSVVNARIKREVVIDDLFIFPAATDDGNAVGAALYAHHVLTGSSSVKKDRPKPLKQVYWGPSRFDKAKARDVAERWRLHPIDHVHKDAAAAAAAKAIAHGDIIGWFQDRAEFGPRALGARSILCHPGLPGMKDRLNARVKFREAFRPFAASVLAEAAADWFEMPMSESPFMLVVCPVRPHKRQAVNEIVHVDGSCRIQTVDADLPNPYRRLIEAFAAESGLPMVLNTSFNLRGMPIVETIEDAINCLYGSRLDRLFIGNLEFAAPKFMDLRPVPSAGLVRLASEADGSLRLKPLLRPAVMLRNERAEVFAALDRDQTLAMLAERTGIAADTVLDHLLDMRRLGLIDWADLPSLPRAVFLPAQYDPEDDRV